MYEEKFIYKYTRLITLFGGDRYIETIIEKRFLFFRWKVWKTWYVF